MHGRLFAPQPSSQTRQSPRPAAMKAEMILLTIQNNLHKPNRVATNHIRAARSWLSRFKVQA